MVAFNSPTSERRILFREVPDANKRTKNRLHADLRGRHGSGSGWVTFADPEGNEFCVVRSQEERGAS